MFAGPRCLLCGRKGATPPLLVSELLPAHEHTSAGSGLAAATAAPQIPIVSTRPAGKQQCGNWCSGAMVKGYRHGGLHTPVLLASRSIHMCTWLAQLFG